MLVTEECKISDGKPIVQVSAIMNEFKYEEVGTGTLEIVSDADLPEPQHYIEVSSLDTKELILRSRLQLRNNFQRQQKAIICWEDNEQLVSEELALSFEKMEECDIYWKFICEKIGKNYLEISGQETLNNPNPTNLPYILSKAKSSYDLIAFHITNSETFMTDLNAVFCEVREEKDKTHITNIMLIVKEILSHSDAKVINALLERQNFSFLLQLYQEYTGIDFPNAHQSRVMIKELVPLSEATRLSVIKIHNSLFFRDCMIDLSKDISLEHILNFIIRQTQIAILNDLLHDKVLEQLVEIYKDNQKSVEGKEENLILFIFEIIGMLKLVQSQTVRKKYVDSFYSSGIFRVLEELFLNDNQKVLQIFDFICLVNPHRFLLFFRDQFRESPSINLNRIISKEYSTNPKQKIQRAIINFLNTILTEVVEKKQFLEFFNGTFLYSVFNTCKIPYRNLSIIRMLMEKTAKVAGLTSLIIKTKFFYKLELTQKTGKKTLLQLFKVLKLMVQRISQKNMSEKSYQEYQEEQKLTLEVVQSGVFKFCLDFLAKSVRKNSLLVSVLLSIISLIADMPFNGFIKYLKQFPLKIEQIHEEQGGIRKLKDYLRQIDKKEEKQSENNKMGQGLQQDVGRRHHRGILEDEQEERYLLEDDQNQQQTGHREVEQNSSNIQDWLLKMKQEMKKERIEEDEKQFEKKIDNKANQQQINLKFDFDPLDE